MAVAEYSMRPAILRMLTASTPSLANISRAVARIFSRRLSFSRCLRCAEPTRPPNGGHLLNVVKCTDAVVMRQAKGGFGRRLPAVFHTTTASMVGVVTNIVLGVLVGVACVHSAGLPAYLVFDECDSAVIESTCWQL